MNLLMIMNAINFNVASLHVSASRISMMSSRLRSMKEVDKLCSSGRTYTATLAKITVEGQKKCFAQAKEYFTPHLNEFCTSVTTCL